MQAAEVSTQSGLAVGDDLAVVDVNREAGSGGMVRNTDDASAVSEEVFENGEVSLKLG